MKYTFSFTTGVPPGGIGDGVFSPVKFQYTGGGKPTCLLLGQFTEPSGLLRFSPPFIEWNLDVNTNPYTINITNMHNLNHNVRYTATVVVL